MPISGKYLSRSWIVLLGTLVVVAGVMISCGSDSQPAKVGNFSMVVKQATGKQTTKQDVVKQAATKQTAEQDASPTVTSATAAPFAVAIKPSVITIAPGQSATATVTTTVTGGFDQPLNLTVSVPAGVHFHFGTKTIPAPGDGTSSATITVPSTGVSGTHQIHVTASDGTISSEATLKLTVPGTNPEATFQGCRYQKSGDTYQGATVSVANPGTYPFNAILYYGTDCNPNNWADQIGFGTPISFGEFDYIFWFTAFANQLDMSTLWQVGSDQSQCVNYEVAPVCE